MLPFAALILVFILSACGGSPSGGPASVELPADLPPGTPPLASSSAVLVRPGEDIQAAVDTHPTGATFLLAAGVHAGQTIRPKRGQTFIGEEGAVLDGQGVTTYAFLGEPESPGVTIRGLVIQGYRSEKYLGAVKVGDFWDWPQRSASGWIVEECEIRGNTHAGISTGPGAVIRGNYIHHNGQTGITGYWNDVRILDNEVAYNNTERAFNTGDEAGGMKLKKTRDLVIRGNFVHHNWGKGIWLDGDNIDALVEDNRVDDNAEAGIVHEIGYRADIRDNTVRRNAVANPWPGWNWNGGIVIVNSSNVEVTGNVLEDNRGGITAVTQNRGSGAHGPWRVENLDVHHNRIRFSMGSHGLDTETGDQAIFGPLDNRFRDNDYVIVGDLTEPFRWGRDLSWAGWLAAGNDLTGSLQRE